MVSNIARDGGSMLASSRGNQDIGEMVDFLGLHGVNILFCIGRWNTTRGKCYL